MGKYFGTDGFRGRVNETLTAQHAFEVGRFLGYYFRDDDSEHRGDKTRNEAQICMRGEGNCGECERRHCAFHGSGRARIVIGKDTRRSSYMLEYALAAGITASGADAYLLHVTTTPSVSYVVRSEGFDGGVMISASHNAYEDNGLKLIGRGGEKADEKLLSKIEDYLDGKFSIPLATGEKIGRTVDYVAGRNRYLGYLLSLPHTSFRGMSVGLDCANGSAWAISKAVFDALGAEVYLTGAEPDGLNVNRGCGSTHPEELQALVKEKGLDIGFAFDGDADRCIAVDERGEIVDGDGILYLSAKRMKARGELENNGIAVTIMSNSGLIQALKREGIDCSVTSVGDRFIYEEVLSRGYLLGGEQSGHIIFRKHALTGDGILTALKVMETVIESKCPLSCLTEGFVKYPQIMKSVPVKDKGVILNKRVQKAVKKAREMLSEGRLILRPSGTESVVRIFAEGTDEAICQSAVALIKEAICAES